MPFKNARTTVHPGAMPHVLVLKADGGAELTQGERTMWSSDDDPEFLEEFGGHDILDENDIPDVLDFLVDSDLLDDDEADDCEIDIEVLGEEEEPIDAQFEEVDRQ